MSTSVAVYLRAELLPDSEWLFKMVRAMEPGFVFEEGFDPSIDKGWIPCRIRGAQCGFEWEAEAPESFPSELARQRFDRVATASWRSSPLDGICAALVAANIALISGGMLEAPDGVLVDPDDALAWATENVATLKKGTRAKTQRKPAKPDPNPLVAEWLSRLRGARVSQMMRSLPDDPLVSIAFDNGVRLQARRWTFAPSNGEPLSTRTMPREMSDADQQVLAHAVDALITAVRADPVASAALDAATLDLRFELAGATFTVHAQAARYASPQGQLFKCSDRWDLMENALRVYPDTDEGRLVCA